MSIIIHHLLRLNTEGHSDKLFKRDFAGELMDKYTDLILKDYGFAYKRDPSFPLDDIHVVFIGEKGLIIC